MLAAPTPYVSPRPERGASYLPENPDTEEVELGTFEPDTDDCPWVEPVWVETWECGEKT